MDVSATSMIDVSLSNEPPAIAVDATVEKVSVSGRVGGRLRPTQLDGQEAAATDGTATALSLCSHAHRLIPLRGGNRGAEHGGIKGPHTLELQIGRREAGAFRRAPGVGALKVTVKDLVRRQPQRRPHIPLKLPPALLPGLNL